MTLLDKTCCPQRGQTYIYIKMSKCDDSFSSPYYLKHRNSAYTCALIGLGFSILILTSLITHGEVLDQKVIEHATCISEP